MPRSQLPATVASARAHFGDRPFTSAEALAAGLRPAQIRRAVTAGLLTRVRRDVYSLDPGEFGLLRQRVLLVRGEGRDAVLGVRSSAHVWGIPEFGVSGPLPPPSTTLLLPHAQVPRRGSRAGIQFQGAELDEDHITEYRGMPITTPLRTGFDVARALGRSRISALVPLCGAMRAEVAWRAFGCGLADISTAHVSAHEITEAARNPALRQQLQANLSSMVDRANSYGMRWVRRVILDVEPLLESWLESVAWAELTAAPIPRPVPQAWVKGASGRWFRSDFLVGARVVVEVDGAGKYTRQTPWQEKQRQADLEAAGYWVVRCTCDELLHFPGRVIARIRLALERAGA